MSGRKILKANQMWRQLIRQVVTFRLTAVTEAQPVERTIRMLQGDAYYPRILFPLELSFKNENRIKILSDKIQDSKVWKNYQSMYFSKKETKFRQKEWNTETKGEEVILAFSLI